MLYSGFNNPVAALNGCFQRLFDDAVFTGGDRGKSGFEVFAGGRADTNHVDAIVVAEFFKRFKGIAFVFLGKCNRFARIMIEDSNQFRIHYGINGPRVDLSYQTCSYNSETMLHAYLSVG
jgi:hypothetical protein